MRTTRLLPVILSVALGCAARSAAQLPMTHPVPASTTSEPGGLGIGLRLREGHFVVEQVATGGGADLAGIVPGEHLLRIDGASLEGLTLDQAVARIQGAAGTAIKLEVRGGSGNLRQIVATRRALQRPGATGRDPEPTPRPKVAPHGDSTDKRLVLARRTVADPQVGNRPGFEYFVPSGWRERAGVAWDPNTSLLATMRLELEDPATGMRLEWLPTAHFTFMQNPPGQIAIGGNWMGATFLPPTTDPAEFVQAYWVPQGLAHLRGLRPTAVEPREKLAREYVRGQPGWNALAVRLRYEYEARGEAWEEDLYLVLNYAPNQGTPITSWNVQGAVSCRAPKGLLDRRAGLVQALVQGASFTPEWLAAYAVVKQLFQQRMLSWQQDTVRFGQQLQQYNDQIARQGQQIHEERMRSWDRIAESQREYLGGVETYTDPYEQRGIYLPAGYKDYWVNAKGQYLLSEQVGFDPNVGNTEEWRRMPRRDPMRR